MNETYNPTTLRTLIFEPIEEKHLIVLEEFQTFQTDLKEFLIEDAWQSQQQKISSTYLVFDRKDRKNSRTRKTPCPLLGYITILNDSINLDGDLKTFFRTKGIEYKSLPAMKIGRLCIDDRHRGKGLGKCLLAWAVNRVVYMNTVCACRFITLEAKRHQDDAKDSYHFYRKFGFSVLKRKDRTDAEISKQNSGVTHMYIDLYKVITAPKPKKQHK